MTQEYKQYFPIQKASSRTMLDAIEFAINAIENSEKRFCIIEAGTGVGKICNWIDTLARYFNNKLSEVEGFGPGAYFLTTQKILQEQYEKDFGGPKETQMKSIYSATNYKCGFPQRK